MHKLTNSNQDIKVEQPADFARDNSKLFQRQAFGFQQHTFSESERPSKHHDNEKYENLNVGKETIDSWNGDEPWEIGAECDRFGHVHIFGDRRRPECSEHSRCSALWWWSNQTHMSNVAWKPHAQIDMDSQTSMTGQLDRRFGAFDFYADENIGNGVAAQLDTGLSSWVQRENSDNSDQGSKNCKSFGFGKKLWKSTVRLRNGFKSTKYGDVIRESRLSWARWIWFRTAPLVVGSRFDPNSQTKGRKSLRARPSLRTLAATPLTMKSCSAALMRVNGCSDMSELKWMFWLY